LKRAAAVLGLAVLGLAGYAPAGETTYNFSGEWILNTEKSEPPSRTATGQGADASRGGIRTDGPMADYPSYGGGYPRTGGTGTVAPGSGYPRTGGSGPVPGGSGPVPGGSGTVVPGYGVDYPAPGNVRNPIVGVYTAPDAGIYGGMSGSTSLVAKDAPWVLTLTGTSLSIRNDYKINGRNFPHIETYVLDGKKHEETIAGRRGDIVKTTRASLKKNKIKIEITMIDQQGNRSINEKEFKLSKDGATLTLEETQELIYQRITEKQVFDRR